MKWLILILLIACQNKTPPYQDLSDNDGDGKRDIDEILAGSDPMISEMKTLPLLEMTLEHPELTISITNSFDVNQGLATLAVKPTLSKFPHDLLAGKRGIVKLTDSKILDKKSYDMNLFLKLGGRERIMMSLGTRRFELIPGLKISLTKEEIIKLKTGQIKVEFEGESEEQIENIHSKTYKVIYVTETESLLYYVSHNLSFKNFLRSKKLGEPRDLNVKSLFYIKTEDDKSLWLRKVGQDFALFEMSSSDLNKIHMKNFDVVNEFLVRRNGDAASKAMKISENGKTIYQIQGSKILRHFSVQEGQPVYDVCIGGKVLAYRAKNSESMVLTSSLIQQNLDYQSENTSSMNLNNDLVISLEAGTRSFPLTLKQLGSETYQFSAYDSLKCSQKEENLNPPKWLNQEVEFKLNITSYLEKDGF